MENDEDEETIVVFNLPDLPSPSEDQTFTGLGFVKQEKQKSKKRNK